VRLHAVSYKDYASKVCNRVLQLTAIDSRGSGVEMSFKLEVHGSHGVSKAINVDSWWDALKLRAGAWKKKTCGKEGGER
jgi:hypothetical protein